MMQLNQDISHTTQYPNKQSYLWHMNVDVDMYTPSIVS